MKAELQKRYFGLQDRLNKNFPGYWMEFFPYIILLLLAAFADFFSTYQFMSEGSVEDEFHPVIRFVSHLLGPFFGPLIGKIAQVLVIIFFTVLFRPFARIIFVPVIVVCLHAAWYNIWGIHFYTPRFLYWFAS
jgi:hypothetical protein